MDIHKPLYWHQGLFLQPQHFQLLDRSFRSLLGPYQQFLLPHFWGAGDIEIQESALENRTFSLLKGNFLFKEGAHVVLPYNARIEARSFEEAWEEGGKPVTVYVGLKRLNDEGENVTVLDTTDSLLNVMTRFVTTADSDMVKDLHSDGPQANVKKLSYVLKIYWETEKAKLGDYELIPIAQLTREDGDIVLSSCFIPPCLTITSFETLLKIVREVRDLITAESHRLEEEKTQRGIYAAKDMVYLLALRSFNRFVPLLHHITETQQVHPWSVYGTLRQLVGELSTFSEKVNVLGEIVVEQSSLPAYDHGKLWECFSDIRDLVKRLIRELPGTDIVGIPMAYDGAFYSAELSQEIIAGNTSFYLVLKSKEDSNSIAQAVAKLVKVSSRESLPNLINQALSGITLDHLPVPPHQLPKGEHYIYFVIDHHSEQWAEVESCCNIALFWESAPKDLEAKVFFT